MFNYLSFSSVRVWLLVGALLPGLASATASAARLLQDLRSDHAALQSAEQDFRDRRDRGVLSGSEAAEYASYVARLHRRVAEDCVALAEQAIPVPDALNCPDNPRPSLAPADIDQASEQTTAEATARLDAELFSGLGDFDEMLLREQARIKAATPHTDTATSGTNGAGGAGSGERGNQTASGHAGGQGEGDFSDGRERAGAGAGAPLPPGESSAPPGTPDGSDDDVVARQLREAAEKEADPELKKKLWEEYRKYKEGIE